MSVSAVRVWGSLVRRAAGATSWNLIAAAALLACEKLVVTPILYRTLDAALFGSFVVARGVATVVDTALAGGVLNVVLREHGERDAASRRALFRTATSMTLALGLLVALVLVFFSRPLGALLGDVRVALFLAPLSLFVLAHALATVLQTHHTLRVEMGRLAAYQVALGLGYLLALPLGRVAGPTGVALGFGLSAVVVLGATLVVVVPHIRGGSWWDRDAAGRILRTMWPFALSALIIPLSQSLDRLLVGAFLGPRIVARYFASVSVAFLWAVPVEALAGTLVAMLAARGRSDGVRRSFRPVLLAAGVGLPGVVFLLGAITGPFLVDALYGAGTWRAGKTLYLVVLAGAALGSAYPILRSYVLLFDRASSTLYLNLASMALAVALLVGLIAPWGMLGAAVATSIAAVSRAGLFTFAARRTMARQRQSEPR